MPVQHALDHMPRPLTAVHHRADDWIGLQAGLLHRCRRILQVQRYRGREHLDVADLFGRGIKQDVAILGRPPCAPGLEEILKADADLAFDAADGLLQLAGEDRIGLLDPDRILQSFVEVVHAQLLLCSRYCAMSAVGLRSYEVSSDDFEAFKLRRERDAAPARRGSRRGRSQARNSRERALESCEPRTVSAAAWCHWTVGSSRCACREDWKHLVRPARHG